MNCLLAILLLTDKVPKENDRLAIIGLDRDVNFFQMYSANGMRQFPSDEASDDIMMAPSWTHGPGTYITTYCSTSQTITPMINFITASATQVTDGPQEGFQQDRISELNCYNYIESKLKSEARRYAILAQDLISNNQCTQSMLYSLQFQGKISCVTPDRKVNAPHDDYSGKVVFNEYYSMASVVLKGKFLMTQETNSVQFGLAWHQGNLKIFARKNGSLIWRPINDSKQDLADSQFITAFLVNSFHDVGLIRTESNMVKYNPNLASGSDQDNGTSQVSARQSKFKALLRRLGNQNLKFTEIPAKGFFVAEVDKSSRY